MHIRIAFLPAAAALASCGMPSTASDGGQAVENAVQLEPGPADDAFVIEDMGTFDEPWAMAFAAGTDMVLLTQKAGTVVGLDTKTGARITVGGVPEVAYGGQGGLGDIAFLPSESSDTLDGRTIYLSYAEPGEGDTRGAAAGRGTLSCETATNCTITGFDVFWRQPKVTGRGHYSHRFAFSPDGEYLFISSGDRQKMDPAQDTSNVIGTVVRLLLDGTPAPGNPLADKDGDPAIWSWGHRNLLGLEFDADGQLWDIEHGPRGGDELNKVEPGQNYGWPVVSNGIHYNGDPIPDHATRPEFTAPAISWDPVIAPGGMLFYSGKLFPSLEGHALVAGLSTQAIIDIAMDGEKPVEAARYEFDNRLRAIEEAPDGAIWVAEDGSGAKLWRLTPKS
ncbi:PQQ-dependent sugar dehydrogenase [Croceicoccus sp. 1NDH52]|nr:PQQ-dependent sugar dehydrogenase [Croceicoccus gelatinilyticus]